MVGDRGKDGSVTEKEPETGRLGRTKERQFISEIIQIYICKHRT